MTSRTFPPQVFARLDPQQYMERHLEQGVRPTGRKLDEFRPVEVQTGDKAVNALGSSVVKVGDCTVICGILGGLTDFEGEGGVYPNVKIHRMGRVGVPTPEEMCLSALLDAQIRAAAIPQSNFKISVSDQVSESTKELVLRADIQVLSRTGPCTDACWAALVAALRDTKMPDFYLDEKTGATLPHPNPQRPLELPPTLAATSYNVGLLNGHLIADVDGPTEEASVRSTVEVFKCQDGSFSGVYMNCPHESFTLGQLKSILEGGR